MLERGDLTWAMSFAARAAELGVVTELDHLVETGTVVDDGMAQSAAAGRARWYWVAGLTTEGRPARFTVVVPMRGPAVVTEFEWTGGDDE